jgi:hypothetical protein
MKIMTIILCIFTVLSVSANSSTNVQVNECTQVISIQLLDILSQEKNVSYDDAQNNWTGYNQVTLTGKTQSGLEQYKVNINTGVELYKVKASVDSMCDVVDYKITNVNQCIETCYAYYDSPRSELKSCVNACK